MTKKGLGRGLDSLFGDFEEESEQIQEQTQTIATVDYGKPIEIALSNIDNNPNQPRKQFNQDALNELATSIQNMGVIQPIVVVPRNNRYMIVSGERRWRASKLAGLKTMPCIIKDYTDEEVAQIALIENLQREDLNPIESAHAIQELISKFNMTQESVSDKIGKSRPAIANTLRLLSLSEPVISLIEQGRLSAGHGKILVGVDDPKLQKELAELACDNKITVRELEKYLKIARENQGKATHKRILTPELKEFSNKMQNYFGSKVTVLGNEEKGKIYINYYSKAELDRIYSIINK